MVTLWRIIFVVALMAGMMFMTTVTSPAENKKPVLKSFEAFQQHFDQNQGRHRLVLLADPG